MSGIDELAAIIRRGCDEDELWAAEASRNDDAPVVDSGEHWHWQCSEHDIDVEPQPGLTEYLETGRCDCFRVGLRSVEVYPTMSVGDLPHLLFGAENVPSAAGGHIARHSPARVLREVGAKRALLAEALSWGHHSGDRASIAPYDEPCRAPRGGECDCGRDARVTAVLQHLAAPYTTET